MSYIFCVAVTLFGMFGFALSVECNPCKENWVLIFHATSGSGEDVLKAWKTRHNNCDLLSGICPCSTSNGCLPPKARFETLKSTTKTLRSPYINYWNSLNINKVKLELNTRGNTVAFIEFDGKDSNYLNWFDNSRILSSSWTDVHKSQTYNVFSIDKESRFYRHFYINKSYGGCPQDVGWLAVKESANFTRACDWDKHSTYPQFLYSRNGKVTKWNDMEFGKADVLNIYVQMG
ncbi:uncharacterized protein LOC128191556 [Crassostrea angulata]|uniref:uncharacterized protein LOC128191556 n=1 Tax=Magallana angulata TaxID=2784310 RepID=UPI0005C3C66D|nr:uncharacterized protein LOC105318575 [Crassostrea gigas]XP_052719648.1 uncharacterized protein LOC128191556 [Crassostrea angulata]|eukprot:XP_011414079.1 PREDICTED: uncharacterized protein LOC105318575 [Crassostrea gigas]